MRGLLAASVGLVTCDRSFENDEELFDEDCEYAVDGAVEEVELRRCIRLGSAGLTMVKMFLTNFHFCFPVDDDEKDEFESAGEGSDDGCR